MDILVPLGLFAAVTLIVIFTLRNRHRERMGLIEQGINPLTTAPSIPLNPGGKALFGGLVLTAVGLGIGISKIIYAIEKGKMGSDEPVYFSLVFLGVGIAMIIYWRLTAPQREEAKRLFESKLTAESNTSQPAKPASRTDTTDQSILPEEHEDRQSNTES